MRTFATFTLFALLISQLIVPAAHTANRASVEKQFNSWLQNEMLPLARQQGISAAIFKKSLSGTKLQWKLPDLVMPGSAPPGKRSQSQAEFRGPIAYFSEKNLSAQTRIGRSLYLKWKTTLARIEKKYGVPGRILISIWGRETAFGRAKIPHSAIRVLATKAFMSTRKELFRDELIAALKIVQNGHARSKDLKGSRAGALGQPQFMPSSFLKFAVDFDGDGKKDIWNSVPDSLASMANFLMQSGWEKKRDWGFEVQIPTKMSCAQEGPDRARKISQWKRLGIGRISGKAFPGTELGKLGMMMVPAGRAGPHFIVTGNFYTIKKYNNSDLYALYVGNLADRIAYGSGKFKTPWERQEKMLRSQIAKMQGRLEKSGYDVGGADGLPGFKTRRSIGEWQTSKGLKSTCFPNLALIKKIR